MSICREIRPLLDELADGGLDEPRARAARAHLRLCPECAHELDQIEKLGRSLASLGTVDPPTDQWSALAARLDNEEASRPRLWWLWHAWRRRLATGAGALAVCAAVAIILFARSREPLDAALRSLPRAAASADELYEAALREVAKAEDDYTSAVRDLREIVAVERTHWSAETSRAFDENLAVIDAAITRQSDLARRSPGDPQVADALHASYRREIDFLQEAVVRGQLP